MTDKEILKAFHLCNTDTDCDNSDCPYKDMISGCIPALNNDITSRFTELKAENAAMRKQISEMLTPLCTLGDKLYHYELSFGEGFDENGKVIYTSSMDIIETEVTRDNIWRMCDLVQNKLAFFSKEALVASYKERFEKESD